MRGFSSPGRIIFLRPCPLFSNMPCATTAVSGAQILGGISVGCDSILLFQALVATTGK
jgi:hypothetical protein